MRIPLSWLNDYIAVSDDEQEAVADALTMAGLEVEETLETPFGKVWYTKITPNRGDWASVYGTARELAAIFPAKKLTPFPQIPPPGSADPLRLREGGINPSLAGGVGGNFVNRFSLDGNSYFVGRGPRQRGQQRDRIHNGQYRLRFLSLRRQSKFRHQRRGRSIEHQ